MIGRRDFLKQFSLLGILPFLLRLPFRQESYTIDDPNIPFAINISDYKSFSYSISLPQSFKMECDTLPAIAEGGFISVRNGSSFVVFEGRVTESHKGYLKATNPLSELYQYNSVMYW